MLCCHLRHVCAIFDLPEAKWRQHLQVRWEDIGGVEEAKQRLKEAVEWPFRNPEALGRLGAQAPKGKCIGMAPQPDHQPKSCRACTPGVAFKRSPPTTN